MRRTLLPCLLLIALWPVTACGTRTPGTPTPAATALPAPPATPLPAPPTPTDVGVTPTTPLNPSDPPVGTPIVTGVHAGNAALLVWFNRWTQPAGFDRDWYDVATGRRVDGPRASRGWGPEQPGPDCIQFLVEFPMPEGDLLDLGYLIGPATSVVLTQPGVLTAADIATWSVDPRFVAFWVRRPGPPLPPPDDGTRPRTGPVPDAPVFTAFDADGTVLCRQPIG